MLGDMAVHGLTIMRILLFYGTCGKSADSEQMLLNVGSDQVHHCFLTEFSVTFRIKMENTTEQPNNPKF